MLIVAVLAAVVGGIRLLLADGSRDEWPLFLLVIPGQVRLLLLLLLLFRRCFLLGVEALVVVWLFAARVSIGGRGTTMLLWVQFGVAEGPCRPKPRAVAVFALPQVLTF